MSDEGATEIPEAAIDEAVLWLCAAPSPTGEERALCDAVAERMGKLPLPSPIRRYGDSIVVPVVRHASDAGARPAVAASSGAGSAGSTKRPHVALVGHLDTVRTENGPARLEGGRYHGAGSSDMKSGLALMIAIAEHARASVTCDLTLVFYAREEGPFLDNELGPVLDADAELRGVDLAICLEPSDDKLQLGCCGSIHATVTFEGKTSHSARPWQGKNAITAAAPLLARLAALEPKPHVIDGMTFHTATTVTLASGGRGRNVVPDVFTMNLNHRFAPVCSLEEAQAEVRALVGEGAKLEFTDLSPAAPPRGDHPLVAALVASGVDVVEPKQAWTDVARFALHGVPAVNFGPGESAQAHQKNESTDRGLVLRGYRILASFLARAGVI